MEVTLHTTYIEISLLNVIPLLLLEPSSWQIRILPVQLVLRAPQSFGVPMIPCPKEVLRTLSPT